MEGILSVLLQEFPAYTLAELERADLTVLMHILDVRRAGQAIELFNEGRRGREILAERADLTGLLLAMARAQLGDGVTMDDVWADLKAGRPEDEEDE